MTMFQHRVQFVSGSDRDRVKQLCPWAYRVVRVWGGLLALESVTDYQTWVNTKPAGEEL